MVGLRVHIAGSASAVCESALLDTTHALIASLVREVVVQGGGIVVGAGAEPLGDAGRACIFDWTALEAISNLADPAPGWPEMRPERFVAVASQRGLEKVPHARELIWTRCCTRSDFGLELAPPGWRMAGVIRERQVTKGDILVAVGGGAGVEHLAELYIDEGKPVMPLHVDLGSYSEDGNGGSRYLYEHALSDPLKYGLALRDGAGSAVARLSALRLTANTDGAALAQEAADFIAEIRPRRAFYVRLLDAGDADYADVERFFREVVDDVVLQRGFTPYEMGRDRPAAAFMNVEIFEALHRAGLVVVDLTGVRPNCTMELGYALARQRRVVLSAKAGTKLPFDEDKLPTHFWTDVGTRDERAATYLDWFDRYGELPSIVD
jgi:hypothetical protein